MDVRSPFFQNVATILVGVMFLNPIVSVAADLTVAAGSGATVGQAGNGVPIVNIATPNGNGLSHNKFKDYNVGQQGLILNNATERTQNTQLGGIILGNANLNGKAAGLILNEVTGANASRLQGYTEVAGKSAHVVVANPHGISCDGCGFINTPRVTLSTGTPIVEGGRLDRFDVNGGSIAIEGQGLNAGNLDQFDLITRSAKINAELHANKLNIIAGRNVVKADDLSATAKAPDGSDKPLLAIDSSALGGMYAGAIRLVGTEAGVGVKLAGDMAASAGDIQIDANGQLTMGRTAASGNLTAKADSIQLEADTYAAGSARFDARGSLAIAESLAAGQSVMLSADQITNAGIVEAGVKADGSFNPSAVLDVRSRNLTNAGTLLSDGKLAIETVELADNRNGTITGETTVIRSGSLSNRNGRVLGDQQLDLMTGALNNQAGVLQSGGDAQLIADTLTNRAGDVVASGNLNASIQALDNTEQGRVLIGSAAQLGIATLDNRSGVIGAAGPLTLTGGELDNRDGGLIGSNASLTLKANRLDSSNGGEVSAAGDIRVTANTLTQQQGRLLAEGQIELNLQGGTLDNREGLIKGQTGLAIADVGELKNQNGELSTNGDLRVATKRLVNADAGRVIAGGELDVQSDALDNHNGGLLSGWEAVTLRADTLDNSAKGTVSSREGSVSVQLTDALNNREEGALASKQALNIRAGEIDNGAAGILSSEAAVSLQITGALTNASGLVSAGGALSIKASDINNQAGDIRSGVDLLINAANLDNSGGRLSAGQALSLTLTNRLLNTLGGQLVSAGPLRLAAREVDNRGGQLASQGLLELFAAHLNNSAGGTLAATGALRLDISGQLDNSQDGLIYSQTDAVTAQAAALNNQAGSIQGKTALGLNVGSGIDNRSGRLLSEQGDVVVAAGSINNETGGLITSLAGWVKATVDGVLDNQGGTIQANDLSLDAGSLDNRGGHVSAVAGDTTVTASTVNNRAGGLYARDALTITGASVDNHTGKIGAKTIDFSLTGTLNNNAGLIESGSTLAVSAARLSNVNGAIRALGGTGVTVIAATDTFDNRTGLLETANTDAQFALGGLLNTNGILRHVGTGSMTLASDNAIEAGGTLTTTGDFSLTAASWTHGGTLQARNLTLNVGTLTQTASGRLLASETLKGTGGNWINNGLIASDGALDLQLTGRYSGIGRLTSLGGMDARVGAMTLDASSHLTSGDYLKLDVAGALANGGRLTASTDLTLTAGRILNTGTLGAAETVSLAAATLDNDRGLIFSGADMTVAADAFTNAYGDFYSLGALTIGGHTSARAALIDNVSGSLEAAGDVYLQAKTLRNRREVFSLERTLVESAIGVYCYDCKGDNYTVDYIVRDIYEGKITDTTPAAHITAGRDLRIVGEAISNEGSILSAVRNIDITGVSFANQGASGGTVERIRTYRRAVTDGTVRRFISGHVEPYNRAYNPQYPGYYYRAGSGEIRLALPTLDTFCEGDGCANEPVTYWRDAVTHQDVRIPIAYYDGLPSSRYSAEAARQAQLPSNLADSKPADDIEIVRGGGSDVQNAVVQAGGNVTIQASQTLTNSVITPGSAIQRGARQVESTSASGTGQPLVVELTSHLPPDLAQQQVNPITLPGFALPQGENGLFRLNGEAASSVATTGAGTATLIDQPIPQAAANSGLSRPAGSHRYLIETNPALTDLKQFMSSDYLLGNLGYDTDATQKRLGDGLYEQRLIREAIVARTGQRYLAGLTNDEAMFRYLMDNALASKNALGLSLGISLTAEQVAALTHDIVWMEEHEVMGEKVLVPVLYLAQPEGRLAANGALIQGRDVTLISGGDLNNKGTLRASQNLKAEAGNGIANSGLIEAGNRLELLASDSIRNAQGGIIAGRDVSLTALTGDVINERSVTRHEVSYGGLHTIQDYVDSAARIEAANSLSVVAGRDIANLGGVLESRGDLALNAGRDVTIASVEQRNLQARGGSYLDEQVTQLGAQVIAGNDLNIKAGRDLTAIASQLDARRDASLVAGGDVVLASAANEDHFYSKSKKVTRSTDKIVQQSTTLQAGRDIAIDAGQDLTLVASEVKAGNNVALGAEQDINILSAKDESASFYFKKKKGSFGRSSSKQQENYDSTNVASVIEAGNDLTVNASKAADGGMSIDGGRDVTVIGSQLKAGGDLLVAATGDVAVLSGVEEHGSYSKKTKSGFLGLSKSGKSQLKTTASQVASELEAGNDVVIAAGNDVRLRASEARARNDVELRAGLVTETGDINLVSANDTAYSLSEQYKKKVGLSTSGGFVSVASAKEAGKQAQSSTSVGSHVAAERDATLQAERDINIVGSGISAGRNVSLGAGRDVNVVAAEDSNSQRSWEKSKQVGVGVSGDDNGVSLFIGAERNQVKDLLRQDTAAASQISAGQDLDITARRDINQTGSDLLASNDMSLLAGRNINIDAARETQLLEQQRSEERQGLGVSVNHNYGNTKDAIANAGNGDNNVSKGSSTLKAIDAYSQFISGPTADVRLGNSKQSTSQQYIKQSNRSSTLSAGNDLNLLANNDVTVRGGQLEAGRDINVNGRDVTFDVAQGKSSQESQQSQSWGGIHGGTSGGIKVGIGGSRGVASEDWTQRTSTTAQVAAGRDINLHASNDLGLIGTQVQAGRDIDLKAGNDLTIGAAQNASSSESDRRSAGGEVGLTFGSEGVGVYASVNLGKGHLEREGERQQEAYLYAGERLSFSSGKDTTIAGAELRGDEVIGRVGRDLRVSSLPDTGEVKGKEFDLSATVTIGPGAGFSGSVGYGETTGKTNWVEEQTRITARDRLDIRTENHTQVDGALIASDNGNLKVDTGTLGFSDIAGEDKERSYYLNVGGTYKAGSSNTQQDPSQEGKGEKGETGWSVEGYEYEKEREQIVRATVGAGEVIVRDDAETGIDSTAGLNRDVSKGYELTKDEEERTDLYVSKSSVEAVSNPKKTLQKWNDALLNYVDSGDDLLVGVAKVIAAASSLADGHSIDEIQLQQQGIGFLLQIDKAVKQVSKGDAGQRVAATEFLLRLTIGGADTAQTRAIAANLTKLAEQNPDGAVRALGLLAAFQGKQNHAQQNFGPLLLGIPFYEALGASLLVGAGAAATPAGQESVAAAANAIMEASSNVAGDVQTQLRLSAELWSLVIGTSFPIHNLDPKYGTLVTPIVDIEGTNSSSGGYAEGGRIITVPHTGGNQLDGQQGSTSYTTPEHQLNPGNMYSEAGPKATGSGAKFADQAKLDDHFARHGGDFGAKNTLEYQAQADKFLTASKPAGVLEKARPNGDIVRYNPSTDEFGVVSSGGSIRTYYKPDPAVHGKGSNLDYFNAQ